MRNGRDGTFVLSWDQIVIDATVAPPVSALSKGSVWRWQGEAMEIGAGSRAAPLLLGERPGLRARAERRVARLLPVLPDPESDEDAPEPLGPGAFEVTDGLRVWRGTVVRAPFVRGPVCLFAALPPRGRDLWIIEERLARDAAAPRDAVVCFTPGTMIRTARGARAVEQIGEGDLVQTRDNGCRPVLWTGRRRMSGARLRAMPDLAPVRLAPGALGGGVPDAALIVSPDHRVLLAGARAEAALGAAEVLARAGDLVDGHRIRQLRGLREMTYLHLALEAHEIVFANDVAVESFHPGAAGLQALCPEDRRRLARVAPQAIIDPMEFGAFARRLLTPAEAAILAA